MFQIIGLTIASIGIVIGTGCIVVNTWRKAFDDGPWERMSRSDFGDRPNVPAEGVQHSGVDTP